jgi:hypothetical protein
MEAGRPWVKYVAIGCGGLVVLVATAIAVVFFAVARLTAAPEQVARDFVAATSRGDFAAAHAHFAAPLKDKQSVAALEAAARETPSIFKVADLSFSDRSIDMQGATLAGTATLVAGTQVPVSFTLVRERDTWRLLAYRLGVDD